MVAISRRPRLGMAVAVGLSAASLSAGAVLSDFGGNTRPWWASVLLASAALLPVAGLLLVFFHEDRHEPEPPANLLRYFLWGIASFGAGEAYRALVVALFPNCTPAGAGLELLWRLVVVVGVGEEIAKYGCFRFAAWGDGELDEPYDGCIYAAYLALGFAAIENVGFVVREADVSVALGVAALRTATAVPAHALFGAAWGLAYGLSRFHPRARRWRWIVLAATMLVHGLFDWIAISATQRQRDLAGYLTLVAMLAVATLLCVQGIRAAHRLSPHRR